MQNARVVFIIPGFTHSPTRHEYEEVADLFRNQGFSPIMVTIPWKRTTISQNVEYFLREYKKVEAREKYFFGFSFGAIIAYIASTKTDVKGQILCSLSPYFLEDLHSIRKSWIRSIGKRRLINFNSIKNVNYAYKVKTKTIFLYGANESKELIHRVKNTYKLLLTEKKLIVVNDAMHDIGDKNYIQAINTAIKILRKERFIT